MDENKTQVGVVSFGYGGCASSYQDVYAKVSTYAEWIESEVNSTFCPAPPAPSGSNAPPCVFFGNMWNSIRGFFGGR